MIKRSDGKVSGDDGINKLLETKKREKRFKNFEPGHNSSELNIDDPIEKLFILDDFEESLAAGTSSPFAISTKTPKTPPLSNKTVIAEEIEEEDYTDNEEEFTPGEDTTTGRETSQTTIIKTTPRASITISEESEEEKDDSTVSIEKIDTTLLEIASVVGLKNILKPTPVARVGNNVETLPSTSTNPEPQLRPVNMANNTTLREAQINEGITAATPKFISPEVFNPASTDPHAFLRNFERCALANGWKDAHRIRYFGTFLDSAASGWYRVYSQAPANATKTWQDVKEDFARNFGGEDTRAVIRRKLRLFKQKPSQDILPYYFELLDLLDESEEQYSAEEIQAYFEDGLSERYINKYNLIAKSNMNKEELRQIVYRLAKQKDEPTRGSAILYTAPQQQGKQAEEKTETRNIQPQMTRRQPFPQRTTDGRPICGKCGKRGHAQYNCGRDNRRCFTCDQVGHIARYCRSKQQPQQRNPQMGYRQNEFQRGREPGRFDRRDNNRRYPSNEGRRYPSNEGKRFPSNDRAMNRSPARVTFQSTTSQGNESRRY